jgi:hypothetical protein
MTLKFIYYGLLALCLVTLLLRYKKLPGYCLWFIPIIFFALITESVKDYFEEYKTFIQRVYQVSECFLLLCFFNAVFVKQKNKTITWVSFFIYTCLVMVYYSQVVRGFTFAGRFFDLNLEAFIVCILVVLFFFEMMDYKPDVNLSQYGAFWINAANLIFYGGSFFAYAFYDQLAKSTMSLEYIPKYLNLFLYCAYFLIFALIRKPARNA